MKDATILFTKLRQRRKLPLPELSTLPEPSIKKARSRRARQAIEKILTHAHELTHYSFDILRTKTSALAAYTNPMVITFPLFNPKY